MIEYNKEHLYNFYIYVEYNFSNFKLNFVFKLILKLHLKKKKINNEIINIVKIL